VTDVVEQVGISIGGRDWFSWSDFELKRSIDAVSTFSFTAPFEPERREFRDTFKPFSFAPAVIATNGELLCNGTMLGVEPNLDVEERSVAVSGYGKPGVLVDCCMPASALPFATRGCLRDFAQKACDAFALALVVEGQGAERAPFAEVVKHSATEKPFGFLTKLAQQRRMLLNDTEDGSLRLWCPASGGTSVATFKQWEQPAVKIAAAFKPQEWFSEITGMKNADGGRAGSMYTEPNPAASSGLLRPSSFAVDDADKGDVQAATLAALGRMIANALTVTVDVPTWRTPAGALWMPNDTVTVEAPNCMIYTATDFLVRDVTLRQRANETSASLELVLPGVFDGTPPAVLPWD
jgi:prophage tail gpP-like protein